MSLVHKSVDVRADVWQKLRVNAEMSGCSVRDYLTYLIEQSNPIDAKSQHAIDILKDVGEMNRYARSQKNQAIDATDNHKHPAQGLRFCERV